MSILSYDLFVLQQSLIEMYTDVLNLLSDFETKSSRKDGFVNTLPQVLACKYNTQAGITFDSYENSRKFNNKYV